MTLVGALFHERQTEFEEEQTAIAQHFGLARLRLTELLHHQLEDAKAQASEAAISQLAPKGRIAFQDNAWLKKEITLHTDELQRRGEHVDELERQNVGLLRSLTLPTDTEENSRWQSVEAYKEHMLHGDMRDGSDLSDDSGSQEEELHEDEEEDNQGGAEEATAEANSTVVMSKSHKKITGTSALQRRVFSLASSASLPDIKPPRTLTPRRLGLPPTPGDSVLPPLAAGQRRTSQSGVAFSANEKRILKPLRVGKRFRGAGLQDRGLRQTAEEWPRRASLPVTSKPVATMSNNALLST